MPTVCLQDRALFFSMIDNTRHRLGAAKAMAGLSLPQSELHRLHMRAVFALEDTLCTLKEVARTATGIGEAAVW